MKTEFNDWWDKDLLTEDNPHVEGTPAFWAWEGWVAGVNAEHETCIVDIQLCIPRSGHSTPEIVFAKKAIDKIRSRGTK